MKTDKSEPKPTGKRGAAYIRVSDADKQDPQSQRTMIGHWEKRKGVTVSHYYTDTEGRNPRDRPDKRAGFQRLLADVQAGKLDWVVVDSQDRIDPADPHRMGFYLTIFKDHDCELWSVDESQGVGGLLTSPDLGSTLTTSVRSFKSADELHELGKRQVRGKREYAANGEWQGGYVPYGFDVVCEDRDTGKERWRVVILRMVPTKGIWHRLIVYPGGKQQERCDGKDRFPRKQDHEVFKLAPSILSERVQTAEEIFRMFASGSWTVRGLCQRLNERKVDPVIGEGWYHTRLKPMLANPAYHVGGTVWGKNSHGKNAQYVGGRYIIPPKVKGKAKAGRKNQEADWVFPPTGTAIVTKELWDEVQKRLNSPKPTIKRGLRDARLWLSGLLVCGRCGQRMTGWSQGGPHYACTSYRKFGKLNPYGCRLHRVTQEKVEELVNRYLEAIAPDVKALLETRDDPALLNDVHKRLAERETELWGVFAKMRAYLEDKEIIVGRQGIEGLNDILDTYRYQFDQDRERLTKELERAQGELDTFVLNMNRIPPKNTNAIASQQRLIAEADAKVADLKAKLAPLTEELGNVYADLEVLDKSLDEALAAAPGDDNRRKALTLRRVVERIVLHFEHTERPAIDRRSKNSTVQRSPLVKADFVPVTGQTFTMDTGPEPGR